MGLGVESIAPYPVEVEFFSNIDVKKFFGKTKTGFNFKMDIKRILYHEDFESQSEIIEILKELNLLIECWKKGEVIKEVEDDLKIEIETFIPSEKDIINLIVKLCHQSDLNDEKFQNEIELRSFKMIKSNKELKIEDVERQVIQNIVMDWSNGDKTFEKEIQSYSKMITQDKKNIVKKMQEKFNWDMIPTWKKRKEELEMALSPLKMYKKLKSLENDVEMLKSIVLGKSKPSTFDGLLIE